MSLHLPSQFRFATLLLTSLLLNAGCSDSSDSQTSVEPTATSVVVSSSMMGDGVAGNNTESSSELGQSVPDTSNQVNGGSTDQTAVVVSDGAGGAINENSNENTNVTVADETEATAQTLTRVNFDIAVPFLLSDQLQVRLVWGDTDITAMWVTGTSWVLMTDVPANTEFPLTATFYDENGGIELGSVETSFRTAAGAAESVKITSDQWDIDRWDNDSDGRSNLLELWEGTDPRSAVNETQPLAENYVHAFSFVQSINGSYAEFESDIPELNKAINIDEETLPNRPPEFGGITTTREINLSADGNGTYRFSWYNDEPQDIDSFRFLTGTRSSQGNTVSWSGDKEFQTGSSVAFPSFTDDFMVSTSINGRELSQSASGSISYSRFIGSIRFVYSYDIVLDLDSKDTEGNCAVLHGSLTQNREFLPGNSENWMTEQTYTANRASKDERWEWSISADGNVTNGEASVLGNRFYCDFQFQNIAANNSEETFSLLPVIERASSYYENELSVHRLSATAQLDTSVQIAEQQSFSSIRDIAISEDGNGSFSGSTTDNYPWLLVSGPDREITSSGARSAQGNTVSWVGTEVAIGRAFSSSYDENAFEVSSTINGFELAQIGDGTITYRVGGRPLQRYTYDIVLDLRSINLDNTCSVLRGSLSFTNESFNEDTNSVEIVEQSTASRGSSNEAWVWTSIDDGEMQSGLANALGNRFHCQYQFNERF